MSENTTETVVIDEAPKTKKSRKALWITAAAVAGVLAIGGIAAPVVIGNVQHAQASSAFVSAEDAAEAARKDLAKAEAELVAAQTLAAEQYTAAKALADVTPATRIADETVLVEYMELLATYAETADLKLDEALNVVAAEEAEVTPDVKPAPVKTPEATDALNSEAAKLEKQAEKDEKAAKALRAEVKAIEEAYAPIPEAQLVIVESAHVKGTELAGAYPALATQASKDAYAAALAAIAADALTDESDLPVLVKAYVDGWAGVEAAHAAEEARIAAEKAAAEEAARQAEQQNRGGNGGWNGGGGSTGGGNTGGGNTGGGNTGGGNTGGGNTGGGNTGAQPSQPQTSYLQKNGNYVAMHGGCIQIGSHNPGPGGTSAPSYSFPWSATQSGTTWTFYRCG